MSTIPPFRRRARSERGAAALEFALIVPMLLMLLLGTITTGLVYSDHLSVTNAVREAARYGAAADATDGPTWATSVQTRVQQAYFSANGSTPAADRICVDLVAANGTVIASDSGSSCGTTPSAPSGMTTGSCAVRVWMTQPGKIQLAVTSMSVTSTGKSVAYYGRTVGSTCTAK